MSRVAVRKPCVVLAKPALGRFPRITSAIHGDSEQLLIIASLPAPPPTVPSCLGQGPGRAIHRLRVDTMVGCAGQCIDSASVPPVLRCADRRLFLASARCKCRHQQGHPRMISSRRVQRCLRLCRSPIGVDEEASSWAAARSEERPGQQVCILRSELVSADEEPNAGPDSERGARCAADMRHTMRVRTPCLRS